MYPARNSLYVGTHPVFVSHTKEIEQLLFFVSNLQERLRNKGTYYGVRYDCLGKVRRKCSDLLLKLYAEETEIMLMDDLDRRWMQKIIGFVKNVIMKDPQKA